MSRKKVSPGQQDFFGLTDAPSPYKPAPQPSPAKEPELPSKPADVEYLQSREHCLLVEPIVGQQRQKVLEFARECGEVGFTILALQDRLVFGKAEWVSRMVELVDANLIANSGRVEEKHDCRPSIWIALPTKWWPSKEGEANATQECTVEQGQSIPQEQTAEGSA